MKVSGFAHEVHADVIFTGKDLRVMNESSYRNPLVASRNLSQPNGLIWKMLTMMFFVEFGSEASVPSADKRHEMLENGELDNLVLEETLSIANLKDLIKNVENTTPFRNSNRQPELLHCMRLHTDLTDAMNKASFEKDRCRKTMKTAN